jgi:hypothetical protein
MLSCRIDGLAARGTEQAAASRWVRTAQGWERPDRWVATAVWEPKVHPIVVAAGQGLASVMALVALGGNLNVRDRETRAQRGRETRAQRARRC